LNPDFRENKKQPRLEIALGYELILEGDPLEIEIGEVGIKFLRRVG
jgi:hypothetical protein